jgi:PAS domain S-box-containing protein
MESLPNLLIVDDTEENLVFLEALLKNTKTNVIRALSGAEALEKTTGIELAVAILDVRMPVMNGYELAVKMNEERSDIKVPIIFVTAGHINEIDTFKGYESGAVDYIFKPISSFILLSKINVFLDLFNHQQTISRDAELLRKSAEILSRVNAVIKKAEEKYRNYITNAPDGVFITDENGKCIEVNDAACRITGYAMDELLDRSILDILAKESVEEGKAHFRRVNETGTSKAEIMFRHKNGAKLWWTYEAVKLSDQRFLGFAKDITDRKKAEDDLRGSLAQQHQLTQYIEKVREEERVSISRELHDDLGQALTAVKIDLGIIRQKVPDREVTIRIDKTMALVGETIRTVQRLTAQLRPQILDDLGLEAAIEWYTGEFANRTNVQVFLDLEPGLTLIPEASLIIFRIMQESLTNIARHSEATRVNIRLCKTADHTDFCISDNGIGIVEDNVKSNRSFGLISMKERASSLGGTLNISGNKSGGTLITLSIPLNDKEINENSDL